MTTETDFVLPPKVAPTPQVVARSPRTAPALAEVELIIGRNGVRVIRHTFRKKAVRRWADFMADLENYLRVPSGTRLLGRPQPWSDGLVYDANAVWLERCGRTFEEYRAYFLRRLDLYLG